jgi:hypothetical protein
MADNSGGVFTIAPTSAPTINTFVPTCTPSGFDRYGPGNKGDCCYEMCAEDRDVSDPYYSTYPTVAMCRDSCAASTPTIAPTPAPTPAPTFKCIPVGSEGCSEKFPCCGDNVCTLVSPPWYPEAGLYDVYQCKPPPTPAAPTPAPTAKPTIAPTTVGDLGTACEPLGGSCRSGVGAPCCAGTSCEFSVSNGVWSRQCMATAAKSTERAMAMKLKQLEAMSKATSKAMSKAKA